MILKELIEDIKVSRLGNLREKYRGNLSGVCIAKLVNETKALDGGLGSLIRDWKGDGTDIFDIYLIRLEDGKYQTFQAGDRHGKIWADIYPTIEGAAFDFFDRYLNELGHAAPDSIINRKR